MVTLRLSLGLDLARVRDWTALACVEPWRDRLALTHLRRWKPERDDCVDALGEVIPLASRIADVARPLLVIDAQGIGRTVARAAVLGGTGRVCDVLPILPTFSPRPDRQREDGLIYVTKDRLVEALFSAMATGRLVLARGLDEAAVLRGEVLRLERVRTRGDIGWTYSHPDQAAGSHDDLLMATAYALWGAENGWRYRPVTEVRWRRSAA